MDKKPKRTRPVRRRSSLPLNPEIAGNIKWLWKHSELNQHEIAAKLHVNQGRVCEVVNGKRFPDVPPIEPLN